MAEGHIRLSWWRWSPAKMDLRRMGGWMIVFGEVRA